jgi:hypothetical protein
MVETTHRRHALTFKQKMDIADLLKDIVETTETGSFYKPGWTDAAVAKRMKCTEGNVGHVRRSLFPVFHDKFKSPDKVQTKKELGTLSERVADLDSRVSFLEEELLARLQYLESELGVTPPTKASKPSK